MSNTKLPTFNKPVRTTSVPSRRAYLIEIDSNRDGPGVVKDPAHSRHIKLSVGTEELTAKKCVLAKRNNQLTQMWVNSWTRSVDLMAQLVHLNGQLEPVRVIALDNGPSTFTIYDLNGVPLSDTWVDVVVVPSAGVDTLVFYRTDDMPESLLAPNSEFWWMPYYEEAMRLSQLDTHKDVRTVERTQKKTDEFVKFLFDREREAYMKTVLVPALATFDSSEKTETDVSVLAAAWKSTHNPLPLLDDPDYDEVTIEGEILQRIGRLNLE